MGKKRIKTFNDVFVVRCPKIFGESVWFTEKSERDTRPTNFFRLTNPNGEMLEYDELAKRRIKDFFGQGTTEGKVFYYDDVNDIITNVMVDDIILFQNFCKFNHIKFNLKSMEVEDLESE